MGEYHMGHPNLKKSKLLTVFWVILGNFIHAACVTLFLLPADLISCGTTGIGLVVEHLFHIPLSVFIFVFNIAMLSVGWLLLGKTFAATTALSSILYPFILELTTLLLGNVHVTDDILLNTLFSGMGLATGLGIVIRAGASTGGMDIPPLVLKKYLGIPVSLSLGAFDFCIMSAQMLFHPLEDLLYGILLLIVISTTLNKVLMLGVTKTQVKIISQKSDELREAILSRGDRGVTMLHGSGGYRRNETEVILTIISNNELPKIQRIAREIDPGCFMIVNPVSEVWGQGFSLSRDYSQK